MSEDPSTCRKSSRLRPLFGGFPPTFHVATNTLQYEASYKFRTDHKSLTPFVAMLRQNSTKKKGLKAYITLPNFLYFNDLPLGPIKAAQIQTFDPRTTVYI